MDVAHALAVERVAEPVPRPLGVGRERAPLQQDDALEAAQIEGESVPVQVAGAAQVLQAVAVAAGQNHRFAGGQTQSVGETALAQHAAGLVHERRGDVNCPACAVVLVVVENQRTLVAVAVGVGKDVLVHLAAAVPEVVERELGAAGEDVSLGQQRRDLALVARDQAFVGPLVQPRLLELHAVALGKALDLAVAEHRQAGQRRKQSAYAEVLVSVAKLVDGRALVRVAHEVHIALHNVRIELDGLLQIGAVLRVLLVAHHVHERRVVDAMHSQRTHEVALQQPEGLGQQQRSRHLRRNAIHYLAPELIGHQSVELLLRHRVLRARWDRSARAGKWEPEPLDVAFSQHHRGIEADDRKQSRDVQDGLDHMLTHLGLGVVELRGVVPRKRSAIVAVVDVAGRSIRMVSQAKGDGGVRLVVVAVVDLDLDAAVGRQVRPVEAVCRERALPAMKKPVWMLNHPRRVDAHVIRHHIAGQAQAEVCSAVLQVVIRLPAAQVFCDVVVLQRVGGGNRIAVAAQPLDGARCNAALPQSDQPQSGDAARCQ